MSRGKRRSQLDSAALVICATVLPVVMFGSVLATVLSEGDLLAPDFAMFYTAATLGGEGRWDDVYDLVAFHDAYERLTGSDVDLGSPTYGYPPILAQSLGPIARYLSLGSGAVVFLGLTLLASLMVLKKLGASGWGLVLVTLSYPSMLALWLGQNSFLSLAVAGLAVILLVRGKPTWAGAALGLLVFKPQMLAAVGLMFVLAPRRHFRVILGATGSGLAVALASAAASLEAWKEFPDGLRQLVGATGNGFRISRVSAVDFSFLLLGDDNPMAGVLAGILVLIGIALYLVARRRFSGDLEMEIALGFVLAAWVNPWMFVYEWVVLAIPALLLLRRGELPRLRGAFAFFLLGVSAALTGYFASAQVLETGRAFQLAVPVFVVAVVLAFGPAWRSIRPAPG